MFEAAARPQPRERTIDDVGVAQHRSGAWPRARRPGYASWPPRHHGRRSGRAELNGTHQNDRYTVRAICVWVELAIFGAGRRQQPKGTTQYTSRTRMDVGQGAQRDVDVRIREHCPDQTHPGQAGRACLAGKY